MPQRGDLVEEVRHAGLQLVNISDPPHLGSGNYRHEDSPANKLCQVTQVLLGQNPPHPKMHQHEKMAHGARGDLLYGNA